MVNRGDCACLCRAETLLTRESQTCVQAADENLRTVLVCASLVACCHDGKDNSGGGATDANVDTGLDAKMFLDVPQDTGRRADDDRRSTALIARLALLAHSLSGPGTSNGSICPYHSQSNVSSCVRASETGSPSADGFHRVRADQPVNADALENRSNGMLISPV